MYVKKKKTTFKTHFNTNALCHSPEKKKKYMDDVNFILMP